MSIQWFPGHMTKARREIAALMKDQDVVIEILDARMPRASENPLLATLRRGKPCLKILSKADLAEPEVTSAWITYFESRPDEAGEGAVAALALRKEDAALARRRIPELCRQIARPRSGSRALHAMIVGIPNVGKSTLVNTLMGRKVAVAADKAAVTKHQQLVTLSSGIALRDNPGILWPKQEDPEASLRLALAGAIPETAADPVEVALFAASMLMKARPEILRERYKLDSLPEQADEMLEAIGRKRGKLRPGGIVDIAAASSELITAYRTGALGPLSLETPPSLEERKLEEQASEEQASEEPSSEEPQAEEP